MDFTPITFVPKTHRLEKWEKIISLVPTCQDAQAGFGEMHNDCFVNKYFQNLRRRVGERMNRYTRRHSGLDAKYSIRKFRVQVMINKCVIGYHSTTKLGNLMGEVEKRINLLTCVFFFYFKVRSWDKTRA